MKNASLIAAGSLFALLLGGCGSVQQRSSLPTKAIQITTLPKPATAQSAENAVNGLTPDLIYHTISAEIAAQRGNKKMAFQHAIATAKDSRSAFAAERATGFALQAKQTQDALHAAKLWVEIDPESLRAHQISAILNIRLDRLSEAVKHIKRVIEIANRNNQQGYLQAASIAQKASGQSQALALMQQVIAPDTKDHEALYALAVTARHVDQLPLAEQYIQQALQLKPGWTKGVLLLARIKLTQGDNENSLGIIEQALQKNPNNTNLRAAYARTLLELKQSQQALNQFEILDKQQPNNPDTLFALGVLTTQLEQFKPAK